MTILALWTLLPHVAEVAPFLPEGGVGCRTADHVLVWDNLGRSLKGPEEELQLEVFDTPCYD